MALKWKYSQFRASTCFDHSGGRPSIGQTFVAVCFSAQPPMATTIRAKWNIGTEYLRIATRVCSQTAATRGSCEFGVPPFLQLPGKRGVYERAVVVEADQRRTRKTTHRSERRSVLKKDLTGPTLLELYGLRVTQALSRFHSW